MITHLPAAGRDFEKITQIFFIFLLFTNLSYAQETPQTSEPFETKSMLTQAGGSKKISLDIKQMDILDVLKVISMQAGFNIVAGADVRGRVSIFLKNVDAWDAFEIILASNDLAYEKRGDIINVMTARNYEQLYGKKFYDKTKIETIKLKYAYAPKVQEAISQLKTNVGRVVADERSNSVIIMDIPEVLKSMEEMIKKIDVPSTTKVFTLKYANVKDIEEKLKEAITEGVGSVRIDERTNKVVVTDTPQKIEEISKMIQAFDEKTKEVLIEAKIVQLTLSDAYKRGVDWDVLFAGLDIKTSGKVDVVEPTGGSLGKVGDKYYTGGSFTIGELPENGYSLLIKALQAYGRTDTLSNPRIMVTNNEEAHVLVGWKEAVVTTTVSQTGDIAQTAESITYIDIGVVLTVTPTINPDGYITMKIKPEISDVKEYVDTGRSRIPIVQTSEAESTVMIKDGRTMVLGGLMKDVKTNEEKKIPLFGDIPLLGNLFKSKYKNIEKTELAIFLTPHIIEGKYVKKTEIAPSKKKISKLYRPETPTITWATPAEKEAYTNYYASLSNKITQFITENYLPQDIGGRIEAQIVISSDGELVGEPEVLNKVDPLLEELVIRSIKQAAPFPPFPEELESPQESFKVTISLPSKKGIIETGKETKKISIGEKIGKNPYSEYYLTLSELISNYIKKNYPAVSKGGEVQVMFTLSSDGKLLGEPQILNQVPEELKKFSIQAIKNITPFPPFPKQLRGNYDTFKLLINFPSYSQSKRKIDLDKKTNLIFSRKEKNINTVKLTPEEIYQRYKIQISRKISEYVARMERNPSLRGKIRLNFTLFSTGELATDPVALDKENPVLAKMAIESVKNASPFPPFPKELNKDKETFNILISFE